MEYVLLLMGLIFLTQGLTCLLWPEGVWTIQRRLAPPDDPLVPRTPTPTTLRDIRISGGIMLGFTAMAVLRLFGWL